MTTIRHVNEATQRQGIDESIVYSIDMTPWTATPTAPRLSVWERVSNSWLERTATMTTTSAATAVGATVNLPAISNLVELHSYLAVVTCTAGTNILSCEFDLVGEK